MTSAIFLLKKVPEHKGWPKIRLERGGVSYTNSRGKVLERRSGLCPSEKELAERRSAPGQGYRTCKNIKCVNGQSRGLKIMHNVQEFRLVVIE
jgi:hypothetical protein